MRTSWVVAALMLGGLAGNSLGERVYDPDCVLTVNMPAGLPGYDATKNFPTINLALENMPTLKEDRLGCVKVYDGIYNEALNSWYVENPGPDPDVDPDMIRHGHDLPAHCDLIGTGIERVIITHTRHGGKNEVNRFIINAMGNNVISDLSVKNPGANQNCIGLDSVQQSTSIVERCEVISNHCPIWSKSRVNLIVSDCPRIEGRYYKCIFSEGSCEIRNSSLYPALYEAGWMGIEFPGGVHVRDRSLIENVGVYANGENALEGASNAESDHVGLFGVTIATDAPVVVRNVHMFLQLTSRYYSQQYPMRVCGIRCQGDAKVDVEDCTIDVMAVEGVYAEGNGAALKADGVLAEDGSEIKVRGSTHIRVRRHSNGALGYEKILKNDGGTLRVDFRTVLLDPDPDSDPFEGEIREIEPLVSGTIFDWYGNTISGATLAFSNGGDSVISDELGRYIHAVPDEWSGTGTPTLSGYTSEPASMNYEAIGWDMPDQNYYLREASGPHPMSDALDTTLSFTTGGNARWRVDTEHRCWYGENRISARSGELHRNQSSWLQTTVEGPGQLSFWWRVSSENESHLRFYVDNVQQYQIGQLDVMWRKATCVLDSGPHVCRWSYERDAFPSNNNGDSLGQLDCVKYMVDIFGFVRDPMGHEIRGVTMDFGYGTDSTITRSNGLYRQRVPYEWSGIVKPTMPGYSFIPASRQFDKITSGMAYQDFAGWVGGSLPEVLDTSLNFTTGGDAIWFGQADQWYCGGQAARSGNVARNQTTWLQTTVDGPGTVNFCWKVDSWAYSGELKFLVDGVEQKCISGHGHWEQESHIIQDGGSHTLQWSFTNHSSLFAGFDCGWLDCVEWHPTSVPRISGNVSELHEGPVGGVTLTFSNGAGQTVTNDHGYYTHNVPLGWSGSATPSKAGYAFVPASHYYVAVAGNTPDQNYTASNITVSYELAEAIDTPLSISTYGTAAWYRQTTYHKNDGDAGASNPIENGEDSWMETSVEGPGTVMFYWKVSSEPEGDLLRFFVDGVEKERISGEVDWEFRFYRIDAGMHTLQWGYEKNHKTSSGSDCGWVDWLQWNPGSTFSLPVISGGVYDSRGLGINNVNLSFDNGGGSTTTSYRGWYRHSVPYGWSGEVTPSRTNTGRYVFEPLLRTYSDVVVSMPAEDYRVAAILPLDPLAEAMDTDMSFTTGIYEWFDQNDVTYFGGDAAESASVGHGQLSWMETTVEGAGIVSFWWKVSSESQQDLLCFYVDGVRQDALSGDVDWERKSFFVGADSHTLRWEFERSSEGGTGSNRGWVDHLAFRRTGVVELVAPNGGERLIPATTFKIEWASSPEVDGVVLEYSTNSGQTWNLLDGSVQAASAGEYDWTIPTVNSQMCLARVYDVADQNVLDISDDVFQIAHFMVPDLAGSEQVQAVSTISAAGLSVGEISYIYGSGSPVGAVVWQSPDAGTVVDEGDAVGLVVSLGPWASTLPIAETESAIDIRESQATLCGKLVDGGGSACEYRFAYWKAGDTYIIHTPWVGYASEGKSFRQIVNGLNLQTKYYYWVEVRNSVDRSDGWSSGIESFTTTTYPMRLQSPDGGECLLAGTTQTIRWQANRSIETIVLEYSIDSGENWHEIVVLSNTVESTDYEWTVPSVNSQLCLVAVSDANDPSVSDISNTVFCITTHTVPNLTGMSRPDADAAIISAGLTVGTVQYESSESAQAGFLIGHEPTAGKPAPAGSAVDLLVSTGPLATQKPVARTDSATDVASETAALNGTLLADGGSWCEYRFGYWKAGDSYSSYTEWMGYAAGGEAFSIVATGLNPDTRYNFYAEARNAAGKSSGWNSAGIQAFTTLP